MAKYGGYYRKPIKTADEKRKVHPVWRGVGLVFMVLIPFMAYAGAMILLEENQKKHWFAIPKDLILPQFSDPMILIKVLTTVFLAFLGFMVIFFVGLVIVRLFGPSRYGPMDAPPVKYSRRKPR